MSTNLQYLHHPSSQPCRAVHQFMLENDIPYEEVIVDLINGENEKKEYRDIYNPTGQVPVIVDGDVIVWESAAIAFYLNEKFNCPPNWFGRDMQQRAQIQQYLHWHSTSYRRGAGAFFYTHFAPCIWGEQDYSKEIEHGRYILYESMKLLENYWLKDRDYVCGDEVSFADLQGVHELVSHEAGKIIPDNVWEKHPRTRAWFDRLTERPHAKTVSETIKQIGEMRLAGEMIPMKRRTSLAKGTEIFGGHYSGIPYLKDSKNLDELVELETLDKIVGA